VRRLKIRLGLLADPVKGLAREEHQGNLNRLEKRSQLISLTSCRTTHVKLTSMTITISRSPSKLLDSIQKVNLLKVMVPLKTEEQEVATTKHLQKSMFFKTIHQMLVKLVVVQNILMISSCLKKDLKTSSKLFKKHRRSKRNTNFN
jgi:hypothetical protein